MKIIYLFIILNSFKEVNLYNQECVLIKSDNCIIQENCCKIYINNERMCMSKLNLYENYTNRINYLFPDKTNHQIKDIINFDYENGDHICKKWIEMNEMFFHDIKIFTDCICKSEIKIHMIFKLLVFFISLI